MRRENIIVQLKTYPTEKQLSYIDDFVTVIANQITFISEDLSTYVDSKGLLFHTLEFNSISTNEEVQDVFLLVNQINCVLGTICRSIKSKGIEDFKHLMIREEFLKREDRELERICSKLSHYFVLPDYVDLKKYILMNMKQ